MADIHRRSDIDRLIGQEVIVIDTDGNTHIGRLNKYENGWYTMREHEFDYAFRKTHIKSIKKQPTKIYKGY